MKERANLFQGERSLIKFDRSTEDHNTVFEDYFVEI